MLQDIITDFRHFFLVAFLWVLVYSDLALEAVMERCSHETLARIPFQAMNRRFLLGEALL